MPDKPLNIDDLLNAAQQRDLQDLQEKYAAFVAPLSKKKIASQDTTNHKAALRQKILENLEYYPQFRKDQDRMKEYMQDQLAYWQEEKDKLGTMLQDIENVFFLAAQLKELKDYLETVIRKIDISLQGYEVLYVDNYWPNSCRIAEKANFSERRILLRELISQKQEAARDLKKIEKVIKALNLKAIYNEHTSSIEQYTNAIFQREDMPATNSSSQFVCEISSALESCRSQMYIGYFYHIITNSTLSEKELFDYIINNMEEIFSQYERYEIINIIINAISEKIQELQPEAYIATEQTSEPPKTVDNPQLTKEFPYNAFTSCNLI